jgi:hypothetical protein
MRAARTFLVCGSAALIAVALVIQACGSTEETPAVTTDGGGGADVAKDTTPPKDTAAPPEEDATTCDINADFTKEIPDAAIGDSGSTTGICLGCAKQKCQKEITACNTDCPCQGLAAEALDCYLKNSDNPFACAGSFAGVDQKTQGIGLGLLQCINSGCKKECATDSFQQDGGPDAGDGG